MSSWKSWIYILLLGALFFEVVIVFPGRLEKSIANDKEPPPKTEEEILEAKRKALLPSDTIESRQVVPGQTMAGVHLVEMQEGKREWDLTADQAQGQQGEGDWKLKKMSVQFFQEDQPQFKTTGDRGAIEALSKDMEIDGQVITTSQNGYQMSSPYLKYTADKKQLFGRGPVEVLGPPDNQAKIGRLELSGSSLLAFIHLSKMQLSGPVVAQQPSKEGLIVIKSGLAEMNGKDRSIYFSSDVEIKYKESTLKGPEAYFYFHPKTQTLERIEMSGGVKINDQDKMATSEAITVDLTKAEFILNGNPKVLQGLDELVGDRIIFVDNGQRVKIEKVKAKVEEKNNR